MNLIVSHHRYRLAFGVFLLLELVVVMSQKRPQEDGKARPSEGNSPDQDKRRRVPTLRNVVQEVMKLQSVQHLLEPVLEPLIRRVKTCKRKQLQLDGRSQKSPKSTTEEPYPCHHRPTAEECRVVRDELLALHGFPPEFLKYRRHRLMKMEPFSNEAQSEPLINSDDGDHKEESVLDGLIKIVLSQNTTELNSQKAFASLKSVFPTWEDVYAAETKSLENAIRCGGLAPRKASCIKNVLSCLHERKGKLCLEYLRDLSVDEMKSELSNFKGVGPKTNVVRPFSGAYY